MSVSPLDELEQDGIEPDGIELVRSGVDRLAMLDPAMLSDVALADHLLAMRREMDRQEAVFARLARAGHTRGIGGVDGAASTAAWLRHRARMREGDAKAAIDCGEVCDFLSETGEAWRAGEIASDAARTIVAARVEGHDDKLLACEATLLELARRHEMRGLRRATARFRNLARADGNEPVDVDGLYFSRTFGNRSVLSGEFGDLAAETVATALHAYTEPPSDGDPRSTSQRYGAALVRICEVALEHAPESEVRGRPHLSFVLDWKTVNNGVVGRCDGEFTGPIHPNEMRRLLCDCTVSRVVTGPDGLPIDLGRARRTVPPTTRRVLVVRDEGCRFPGCNRAAGFCDAHHVVHWEDGGPTDRDNLLLLCPHHHRVVHQPGWNLEFDGLDVGVFRADGTEVTE